MIWMSIWVPRGMILGLFGSPWAPPWHHYRDQVEHRCIQGGPEGSQVAFSSIVDGVEAHLKQFGVIFSVTRGVQKYVWIAGLIFEDF